MASVTLAGERLSLERIYEDSRPGGHLVRSDGGLSALIEIVAGLRDGSCPVVIPDFLPAEMQEWMERECDAAGPEDGVGLLSSGSSGRPRVNVARPLFLFSDLLERSIDAMRSLMPDSIAATAPIASSGTAYLSMLHMGRDVVIAPPRTDRRSFLEMASDSEAVAIRPSFIRSLRREGLRLDGKVVISSTSQMTPDVEQMAYDMGADAILDVYVATEVGFVGYRTSSADPFTIMPGVDLVACEGEAIVSAPMVAGYYEDGAFVPQRARGLGDAVEITRSGVRFYASTITKAKVSGFTVPLEYVSSVAQEVAPEVGQTKALISSGVLTLFHTGPRPRDLSSRMERRLPWYSVPRRYLQVKEVAAHVARESWS